MENNLSSALSLLIIGMITVFVVLLLVVLTGKVLILIVNRFSDEETEKVSAVKVAAIAAAVELVTKGKGYINKIERR